MSNEAFRPPIRANAGSPGQESDWRRERSGGSRGQTRLRLALAWFGVLGLTSLLIWVSTWLRPPQPARLVLLGAGYEDNLAVPQNVYGLNGLQELAHWVEAQDGLSFWGKDLLHLPAAPKTLFSTTAWQGDLDDLDEPGVVLFLALHGGADTQGAYLLAGDAGLDKNPGERLRLTAILDRLAQLPAEKHKLLLLDATQVAANWRLGMLHNDFARELWELEPRIVAIPNLVVISASDRNQRSWTCDQWRRTAFAHFVAQGLMGAASDMENDGRIDGWELYRYVRGQVQGWVQANRAAWQTPIVLPHGELGRRRAAGIDLAVVRNGYQPPQPHAAPAFTPSRELVEAWNRHQQLALQIPSPAVYSPHTWRLYQDTLLRYEELHEAGDLDASARLASRLKELEAAIDSQRGLDLESLGNTLPMPAAAGFADNAAATSVRAPANLEKAAAELCAAGPEKRVECWTRLQASFGQQGIEPRLLRLAIADLLLRRTAEDPQSHLEPSADVLHSIADPLHAQPAEIHYLLMLRRDLPLPLSSNLAELVRLSLTVRRQAEQAALSVKAGKHPYSERVFSLIRAEVERADGQRRLGEDLLFADAQEWPQAAKYLQSAQQQYAQARQRAEEVRGALATRDEVLARLPYYSQWLASRTVQEGSPPTRHDDLLEEIETLWRQTHRLAGMLEALQPEWIDRPPPASPADPQPRSLAEQAQVVRSGMQSARERFYRWWQELSSAELPSTWHEADHALLVPLEDPQLRLKLLTNKQRTSRRLFLETAQQTWLKPGSTSAAEASAASLERQELLAQESARRQGRLAMAVLGERTFDRLSTRQAESFAQVRHRLDVFSVEQQGWRTLLAAGEQIGLRWRQLPAEIDRLMQEARKTDPQASALCMQGAARLARQLDGVGALAMAANPSAACRRCRMHDLLLWQAGRTLSDRWFAEDPQEEPYFRVAGAAWLADARRLDVHPQAVDELQRAYQQAGGLGVASLPRLNITTQRTVEIDYHLQAADGGTPAEGFPVVWVEQGPAILLVYPKTEARLVRQVGGQRSAGLVTCTFTSPRLAEAEASPPAEPAVEATSITLQGLFRGQRFSITTGVDLHLAPDRVVSRHVEPPGTGIAVRAAAELHRKFGEGTGAIVIVLDASGSMGPPRGASFGPTTKYAEATQALRQVLQSLPAGAMVSVWAFGQAMGQGKTVEQAERTIRRLQEPIAWKPDDPGQLQRLMAQVEYPALEPWNESPLVAAMLAAKEDFRDAHGFKTMLVLTDGMDNRFENNAVHNPTKQRVYDALQAGFQNSGIAVNVVGFKVVDAEEKQARQQFSVLESLDPPGKFMTVEQTSQLASALDAALRQRLHYRIDDFNHRPAPGMPASGLEVGREGGGDQWSPPDLGPGSYKLRVYADRPVERDLSLNRGDRLLARLVETPRGLELERIVYSAADLSWKPALERAGWRMAVLQNQSGLNRDVQMLLSLERKPSPDEPLLAQVRPRECWIEVSPPADLAARVVQRWNYQPGYPAPAWNVDLSNWPRAADGSPARPTLRLWWNADQDTPSSAILTREHDYRNLAELKDRSLRVFGDEVTLLSTTVEPHTVAMAPGVRRQQSCLVVRLRHAPGKPVWARLGGLKPAGEEHRFYSDIGEYTGLFWPVVADEAEANVSSLKLLSLNFFQKEAEQRGCHMVLELPPPQANDYRPRPLDPARD